MGTAWYLKLLNSVRERPNNQAQFFPYEFLFSSLRMISNPLALLFRHHSIRLDATEKGKEIIAVSHALNFLIKEWFFFGVYFLYGLS